MPGCLPPEIIILVLEASNDTKTLRKCSLVCQSWRNFAQTLLFASSTVIVGEELPSILSLLPSFLRRRRRTPTDLQILLEHPRTSHLRRIITTLHVRSDGELPSMASLQLLANLRSFTLSFQGARVLCPSLPFHDDCRLESLTLESVRLHGFHKEPAKLKYLKELTLDDVLLEEWDEEIVSELRPDQLPRLQSLRMRTTQPNFDALIYHTLPHLTHLTSISFQCMGMPADDGLLALIEVNKRSLESLVVHHLIQLPPLDKASFPALQSLSLGSTPRVGLFLEHLSQVLPTLSMSHSSSRFPLKTLTLLLSSTYLLVDLAQHTDAWMAIQDLLLASAEFIHILIKRTLEDGLDEVVGNLTLDLVTVDDLEVHPAFEKLRGSGRATFAVEGKSIGSNSFTSFSDATRSCQSGC